MKRLLPYLIVADVSAAPQTDQLARLIDVLWFEKKGKQQILSFVPIRLNRSAFRRPQLMERLSKLLISIFVVVLGESTFCFAQVHRHVRKG